MNLQRKRRFDAILKSNGNDICSLITPGTEFMNRIEKELKLHLISIQKETGLECIFSSSKVPGEGEVKILNHISNIKSKTETFLISSPDNDMIAAVLSVNKQNIMIVSDQNINTEDVFNKAMFIEHYVPKQDIGRTCMDISILMLGKGNDYLPKLIGSKSDFFYVYTQYIKLDRYLTKIEDNKLHLDIEVLSKIFKTINERFYISKNIDHIENSVKAMMWNVQMYFTGVCPDYSQKIPSYCHSKCLYDLVLHNKKNQISNIYSIDIREPIEHPMTPITFSMSILPTPAQIYLGLKEKVEIWKNPTEEVKFKSFEIDVKSKLKKSVVLTEDERIYFKEKINSNYLLNEFDRDSLKNIGFTELVPCLFFLRSGYCENENCLFDHTPSKVCIYFLQGRCTREYCSFLHPKKYLYEEILENKKDK